MNKRRWRAANLSISEHFYSLENTVSQVLSLSVRPRACSPGVVNCSPFPHRWGKGLQLTTPGLHALGRTESDKTWETVFSNE